MTSYHTPGKPDPMSGFLSSFRQSCSKTYLASLRAISEWFEAEARTHHRNCFPVSCRLCGGRSEYGLGIVGIFKALSPCYLCFTCASLYEDIINTANLCQLLKTEILTTPYLRLHFSLIQKQI